MKIQDEYTIEELQEFLISHNVVDKPLAQKLTKYELFVRVVGFKAGFSEACTAVLLEGEYSDDVLANYKGSSDFELGVQFGIQKLENLNVC